MNANEIMVISIVLRFFINIFIVHLTLTSKFSTEKDFENFHNETFEEMQRGDVYKWWERKVYK